LPPVAFKDKFAPAQTDSGLVVILAVGKGLTVRLAEMLAVQLLAPVTVRLTVYAPAVAVAVRVGVAVALLKLPASLAQE
jgi:hypothetical protein